MKFSPSEELILRAIAHREMYGQQIARAIFECCDRRIRENSLYPALRKLTQRGLAAKRSELVNGNNHDFYKLTQSGINALNEIEKSCEKLRNWRQGYE